MKKQRIIGVDVARALAVIGMIIVNFKVVFGEKGDQWLQNIAGVFDGKAAATFVVLAGVGLALMTNSALKNNDLDKLKTARKRIAKRAIFLFVVGLSYIIIWPADILHFYGVYMAIILLLLTQSKRNILFIAIIIIAAFPVLMTVIDYEQGWNFITLDYTDFWTGEGFVRNLFFNGFHPAIPWTAFMMLGYWLGKQDLHNSQFVKKLLWISASVFVGIQLVSKLIISVLSEGDPVATAELSEVLSTDPMPPMPVYMINGVSIAFTVIAACILLAKRFEKSWWIDALNKTGQLALTFYVAHVIIGMGAVDLVESGKMGQFSLEFSVMYALIFSLCCIAFAWIWRKYRQSGPLEWIMRKLTD